VTPAKLGLVYNISGILALLRSVPMTVARELLYTAQPIDAGRAWVLGMVNHVKTADEIEGFTLGVAAQIALNAPLSVAAAKASFDAFRQDPAWMAAREASEKKAGGSLTEAKDGVLSDYLVPTDYSTWR
jgi:enoyl-CoA hydratase/carnithine racemase